MALDDETRAFFQHLDLLIERGISPPGAMHFFYELSRLGPADHTHRQGAERPFGQICDETVSPDLTRSPWVWSRGHPRTVARRQRIVEKISTGLGVSLRP